MHLFTAVVVAAVLAIGTQAPAGAVETDRGIVQTLAIESNHSRIDITFDAGIPQNQADQIAALLTSWNATSGSVTIQASHPLACGQRVSFIDGNGTFEIAYNCGAKRTMPWGFRLSPQVQAIVVGNVNERGLQWWRNGREMARQAPHVVPPSYRFHGTLSPVSAKNEIDFADYLTFRHDIGPGGTGSVTFAGSVRTTN